jgi:hypothetical protein
MRDCRSRIAVTLGIPHGPSLFIESCHRGARPNLICMRGNNIARQRHGISELSHVSRLSGGESITGIIQNLVSKLEQSAHRQVDGLKKVLPDDSYCPMSFLQISSFSC